MPAQVVSHYRLLGLLGSGGMGVVYRAEDTTLRRTVALKFLGGQTKTNREVSERLRHEARAASALNHPNICTIYEVGEEAGETFIAMEYVEGRSLAEVLGQGALPIETVMRYGRQLASALAHAHDRGVIHGDLKPLNTIITPSGDAKVLDFGLARRSNPAEMDRKTLETATAEPATGVPGTFPYMAPEQIEGGDASPRTDIWSLGIMLYEMAAGRRPFQGENLYLLCNAIVHDSPSTLPPQVPQGLKTIISRCLEKEATRRYQRASETRAALEALSPSLEEGGVPTPVPQPRGGRRAILVTVGIAAAVAAGVATAGFRDGGFWRRGKAAVPSQVILSVLPPTSSRESSEEAFESGLAYTVSARLGDLTARHALAVIPMSENIDHHVTTVDKARKEFGVNLVLVLDAQRAANEVRVNYALIDAKTHQQARGGTVTADSSDPFGLQDRVVESVASALELQLGAQERQTLTSHGTTAPAAYDYYVEGRGYLQDYTVARNVEDAITLFQRALQKDPAYADATAALGEAFWRKYQLTHESEWAEAATQNCEKAAELGPNLGAAHVCLGRVFGSRGNYAKAAEEYRRAIELEPTSDDAYGGLATAYEQLGRLSEAEQLYKNAISARGSYWATYNWLGLFYMKHARYEEAAAMFSQVISLAPDSFTGYYNLGGVRVLQGKYVEAVPILEQSLSIQPTGNAWSNLGMAHFQMRQYAESARNFEEAVKLDQKDYILWGNLGDAYYWTPGERAKAAGAYGTAITLGKEALKLNPNDAQLLSSLAMYHAMRGERKPALENLEASLRLQPRNPGMVFNAGLTYEQLGDINNALDALERAVQLGISREMVRDTPNFQGLRGNPRFARLIETKLRK